jgi:FG-GAP repeat
MRRFGASVLVAATAVATLTPMNLAAAADGTCQTEIPVVGDVDGDGSSDLVVGLPGRGAGEVDLRLTTATKPPLTLSNSGIGGQGSAGDQFGAAVVLADLNNDGCDDILVGAPGANNGAGRVYVVFGAPDGLQATGGQTFNGGAASGDRFGSSLAIAQDQPGTRFDLWVGAPRDDVGSATDAGSVAHYVVTSSALDFSSPVETITQNSPNVPGSAENGDRFGEALSATSRGVLVGDQSEDIGSKTDAGSITLLATTDTDDAGFDQAFTWSQDSSGVPGKPESGDHFGAAVSAFDEHLAAGVPDEDVSGLPNTGMVQLFRWSSATPVPAEEVKQDIPGAGWSRIPGKLEAGDRIGAATVFGRNLGGCSGGSVQIAIGVPGEDIGSSDVDAGVVAVFTPSPGASCIRAVEQGGKPLSGSPEKGDGLGTALALGRHSDDNAGKSDRVFIGVPGEDVGTTVDAGIVQSTPIGSGANPTDITVAGRLTSSVGYSGGAQTANKYGTVIASPAGE